MRTRILNVILIVLSLVIMGRGIVWAEECQYLPFISNDPTPPAVETKSTPPPVETKSTPPIEPTNAPPVEPTNAPITPAPTPTPELIPPHPTATTLPPTVTPTASPTATPTATPTVTPQFDFGVNYEDGQTHGVNSSEESYKTVTFSVGQPAQHGSNALKVETIMSIKGLPVNRYTEVTQYFDRAGWPITLDLIDKKVSWAVYIPHELFAQGENPVICAYLFVKDTEHNPQNSQQECFKKEQAGTWTTFEITVNVEEKGYIDPLFDPDRVHVVGVRFTVAGDLDHEGWIASMDDLKVGY